MSAFTDSVALYRLAGSPPFEGGQFCYNGPCSDALRKTIAICETLPRDVGEFVGPPTVVEESRVGFCWVPADNSKARFYRSVDDLVARSTMLSHGTYPSNFYIVDEDYLAGDRDPPERLQLAFRLCDMVAALSKLALTTADLEGAPSRVLLFIQPAGEKSLPKTLELVARISPDMLAIAAPNLVPLEQLVADSVEGQLHIDERRGFFRLAVADVLAEPEAAATPFLHLVRSWGRVLVAYQRNVEVYLSDFSFEALRHRVISESVHYASKLSRSLNESTSKLLALPLSLAAVAGVQVSSGILGAVVSVLGALLVSILLAGLLQNQSLELRAIRSGFAGVFEPLSKEIASDSHVGKLLKNANSAFSKQSRLLAAVVWTMRCLVWIPPSLATVVLAWRFDPGLHAWLAAALR